jgi:hypothetical protein
MRTGSFSILVVFLLFAAPALAHAQAPDPAAVEFFEKQVRPVLVDKCYECHSDAKEKPKGKLRLDSRAAVLRGGASGPAAVPGKPAESRLIKAVEHKIDKLKMPRDGKLEDAEIAALSKWVEMGLPWPNSGNERPSTTGRKFTITEEQRKFWSFQPVKVIPPPKVKDQAWAKSKIDQYLLAAMEAKGVKPAPPADKRTLLRRVTFDLTGLPPTPEEIEAFLKDDAPEAFARVVDRLLASPQYGERWGRHWLDVVRFADSRDSRGIGSDTDITEGFRYRDWVVKALNQDLPYDQFIIHQIAGDMLPPMEPGGVNTDGLVATGFLTLGEWGTGDADKEKMLTDIVADQIDVTTRSFLGLTMACSRCHDHKFDPISNEDYYALAGIFFSTRILPNPGPKTNGSPMLRTPLLSQAELAKRKQHTDRIAELEKEVKKLGDAQRAALAKELLPQTAKYLMAAWDFEHRPADQANQSLDDFASKRELRAYALRQWIDYIGMGDYKLMTKPVVDAAGRKGVHAWKGEPDCPSLTVNTNDREEAILTFKLPPKSVAVHPGPNNGVAVAWQSPIKGTVRITGTLTDADPAGGDGIAWIIDHRHTGGRSELASGDFPNGGAQEMSKGKNAERLASVEVKAGDRLELLVLPKENYICDTTTVDWVITTADGAATWDLTKDLLDNPHQGNPHADRQGHKGVWHFLDMANSNRAKQASGDPALTAWQRVAADGKRDEIERASEEFGKTFTLADVRSPFWINRLEDEKELAVAHRESVAKLLQELDTLKKTPLPPVPMALAAQEGGVPQSAYEGFHDARIQVRGSYTRLGDMVPRRFPVVLTGENQPPITQGSGRSQLAKWIASEKNPLTARVMINRIWEYHFGQGIVRTASNFGKLGERPTHPKLLDYLADRFVKSGWSIKQMHREILLSSSYQQASAVSDATLKLEPDNLLFSRVNRKRLEAEAIRDNLLAVAGKLDLTMGGPATRDFAGSRRTLYLMTIRSDKSGFGPLFDAADPESSVERRTISTVAPQALFLLNDPFVLEQTKTLTRRLLEERAINDGERIEKAYVLLYGRLPAEEEKAVGAKLLNRFIDRGLKGDAAWEAYCQVLLCANEFIYVD